MSGFCKVITAARVGGDYQRLPSFITVKYSLNFRKCQAILSAFKHKIRLVPEPAFSYIPLANTLKGARTLETPLLISALIVYGISLLLYHRQNSRSAYLVLLAALVLHFGGLVARSVIARHPPFTNMYETFVLLPFLVALRTAFWKGSFSDRFRKILIGTIMVILIIALLLPQSMKIPKPLMPALNSIWMYIHVPAYFFGYMAMIIAAGYAMLILLKKEAVVPENIVRRMDNEVKIAFFFLTVGLITGGIWAYASWGNYWAWDPKETWALINILVLAFYFHLNVATKQKKAVVVIIALLSIAFTYWGVSFILSGLHSYA